MSASWYTLADSSKISFDEEILCKRDSMADGSCLIIAGGWLDSLWMDIISSFGLWYGQYLPSLRFNVKSFSRKIR